MEIIERSSGYWIVDEHGAVDGPFIELEEAQSFYNSLLTLR